MTFPEIPTPQEVKYYAAFFRSLKHVLPCKLCRTSYTGWLKAHPPYFSSRTQAVDWVIDMHNSVNERLGKKQYTKKQALQQIKKMCKRY
jgi:hypothetical protein